MYNSVLQELEYSKSCEKATTGSSNGASWLELLARYWRLGGRGCEPPSDNVLARRPTLKQHLSFFVTNCRRVIERYGDPEAKLLFRPAQCKHFRLAGYGINMHLPCIMADLCLTTEAAEQQHQDLAQLVCDLTKAQTRNLHRGLVQVVNRKLQLRRRRPWANSTQPFLRNLAKKSREQSDQPSENTAPSQPQVFQLACHTCGNVRNCARTTLLRQGQWTGVYCRHCKQARKSSKWLCPCGTPWFTCTAHHAAGFSCGTVKNVTRAKPTPRPPPPWVLGSGGQACRASNATTGSPKWITFMTPTR